ncbi:uncharacterized protein LOC143892795 [Tasmannia lanceolata]|uniref:uncharacterized protein LOC143892795 n=1 Tax=Tasmannia lanceolata TaxID=3420 RepID=UPI0040638571
MKKESENIISDVAEKFLPKSTKKSASDLVLQTYGSLSGRKSENGSRDSFEFPSTQMDLDSSLLPDSANKLGKSSEIINESILAVREVNGGSQDVVGPTEPTVKNPTHQTKFRKTYSVSKKSSDLSKISLPQSAATFYCGSLLQMEVVETCESIIWLNQYLSSRRADLRAGVPGKFLHAVIGQEVSEVGSVASAIMYAFYLDETQKSTQLCTIPIINMKRSDLNMHAEIKWLLDSCHIDQSSLVFIDEIDLSYYDLFGSLKLVLLDGHKLPTKQEALKEALVEIFNCKQVNSLYPWVETVTVGEDCSCCTLIAEKFALTSPEILAGQGFSRLLLSGILLDTENLTNPQCTSKDKYMATLLINGAGRFGCNGIYQILKYKKFDISELKVREILRKDFKKWTRVAGNPESSGSRLTVSNIGMSSIGISVGQLLTHEASSAEEVVLFQQSEKLRLLMIVSGYYDDEKNFKREILASADTTDLMRNLLRFFNAKASQLPLKVIIQPGLREELRAFEIDNKITSRKTIERLLEEFGGMSRRGAQQTTTQ